jgi:hypothetical protein
MDMTADRHPPQVPEPTRHEPVQEIKLTREGALLAATKARYDTLEAYVQQFGEPSSSLPGLGYWTFQDPLWPDLTLLVRTMPRDRCDDCGHQWDHCECSG